MKKIKTLPDLELVEGKVKVTLTFLDEGWHGDYDENDPKDTPLLRMDVMAHVSLENPNAEDATKEWDWMMDSSYCTCIPATNTKKNLKVAQRSMKKIMKAVKDIVESGGSVKRVCQELSWLPDDFPGHSRK